MILPSATSTGGGRPRRGRGACAARRATSRKRAGGPGARGVRPAASSAAPGLYRVGNPPQGDGGSVRIEEHVGGLGMAVARLPHRTGIDNQPPVVEVQRLIGLRRDGLVGLSGCLGQGLPKNERYVGVPHQTIAARKVRKVQLRQPHVGQILPDPGPGDCHAPG